MSAKLQIMNVLSQNYEWIITRLSVDYDKILSGLAQIHECNHDNTKL